MEGTIGEIRMFAGNFEPRSWAFCQGQLMSIAENTALFSILGTTYGGDGQVTFALPNLAGRTAVGAGQGAGLTNYVLGEMLGHETQTITQSNMPAHAHTMMATADGATTNVATGASLASNPRGGSMPNIYEAGAANQVPLGSQTGPAGGNQPFSIIQPVLGINFVICMEGIYPSRN
jgi:microcystin-dependent protein